MNVIVLEPPQQKIGYICVPYRHDNFSVSVKDDWSSSKNFSSIYFVTATFADDIKPYFPSSTNHYLLGKFNNHGKNYEKISRGMISILY